MLYGWQKPEYWSHILFSHITKLWRVRQWSRGDPCDSSSHDFSRTSTLGLPHHKVIQLSPSVKIPQKWSLIPGVLNEHKIQVLKATYVNKNNSEVMSHGTCGSVFVIHLPVSISKRRLVPATRPVQKWVGSTKSKWEESCWRHQLSLIKPIHAFKG